MQKQFFSIARFADIFSFAFASNLFNFTVDTGAFGNPAPGEAACASPENVRCKWRTDIPKDKRNRHFKMTDDKIRQIINISWTSFKNKVASGLFDPENEKMMQLQFAQTLQILIPLFEYRPGETIKVLLEVPVTIDRQPSRRIIDIVLLHIDNKTQTFFPIELKCFREFTRDKSGKKRGAQNLGMYDYWADIENIEQYTLLPNYSFGTQLTLTDDNYYVTGRHRGQQVAVFSTNNTRQNATGILQQAIANRQGLVEINGTYSMTSWDTIGTFHFIRQETTTT